MNDSIIPIKAESNPDSASDDKCGQCHSSICCNYVTHQLDTPECMEDFDYLLWQIAHEGIRIYKDEDGWFLLIESRCTQLQSDGSCGIYDTRPQICRDYENDYCEYDAPAEDGFELYFRDYESLLSYCKQQFVNWGE